MLSKLPGHNALKFALAQCTRLRKQREVTALKKRCPMLPGHEEHLSSTLRYTEGVEKQLLALLNKTHSTSNKPSEYVAENNQWKQTHQNTKTHAN